MRMTRADVLVALIAALAGWPQAVHGGSGSPPAGTTLALTLAGVLALSAAPLLARRIWPVPVFGFVLAASIGIAIASDRHTANLVALLMALYTVATMRSQRDTLACAAVVEVTIVAATIWLAGSSWWYPALFLSGLVGTALGLGLYSATRHAYLAELRDRAARLERERDQQGALAAAAERARIAREMHDIVAHHLTGSAGRHPPASRRPAPAPWPGRRRGAASGARSRPARRAHRPGPLGRTRHHARDPRPGA